LTFREGMSLTEDAEDRPAGWSPANRSFLEYAENNVDCRSRTSFEALFRDNPLKVMSLQPWPLFIEAGPMGELERVALGLDRLLKSVPERFFGNDPARLAAFYSFVNRDLMELIIAAPNGIAGAISRGDFVDGGEGLQCLEFNAGSVIGGWQLQALERLYLDCPVIARFLAAQGLRARHYNTIRQMFRHIVRETSQMGLSSGGALNLALIIHPHRPVQVAIHSSELYNREYRAALAAERPDLDGKVFLCGYADLAEQREGLTYQGERVHAVMDQHNGQFDPRGFRYFKGGRVNLYSGPITLILSDKRNLALLSEHAASQDFTGEERDLLARHLPWTRLIQDTDTIHCGRRVRLPELLAGNRERFVIKKASSFGGRDVHIGKFIAPARWEELLRQSLAEPGWIAQEYVESRPFFFLSPEGEVLRHDLVWGLFAFGELFGGAFLRLQPSARGGVVNTAGGAEVSLLLEVEPVGSG
jgi:hypothetical protein